MKLSALTPGMLQKAIAIYGSLSYPDGKLRTPPPDLSRAKDSIEALAQFQDESGRDMEKKLHRYTLRLGNSRYPFMKFVLQEVLIEGEYFFTIDTHDEMEVKPSFPDYAAWQKLKKFNAELGTQIESRWEEEGLPTYGSLKGLACELIPEGTRQSGKEKILVVDDDRNIRETIAAMLAARGYLIETASDGAEALKMVSAVKPDLIVMDYEMPGMDGLAAIAKLREKKKTKNIPVLLATAGQVGLDQIQKANGFMVKPFQREVLFNFVEHLLAPGREAAAAGKAREGFDSGGKGVIYLWKRLARVFAVKGKQQADG